MSKDTESAPDLNHLLQKLGKYLKNGRTTAFEESLGELFNPNRLLVGNENVRDIRQLIEPRGPMRNEEDGREEGGPLLLGAVHYISPSLGKWFRVLLGINHATEVLDIRPLELSYHDAAYEEVPRDINIPVWKNFRRPLIVEMGNDVPTLHQACTKIDTLHIDSETWLSLKGDFLKLDAREFYRIVVGLDSGICKSWAKSSRLRLSAVLEKLYEIKLAQSPETRTVETTEAKKEREFLLWRTLLFSLFLSIRTKGPEPIYTLLLPIFECEPHDDGSDPVLPRLGTFVGCYRGALNDPQTVLSSIATIREVLLPTMRALAMLELHVLESRGSRNVVVVENIIRSCAIIEARVQEDVNEYKRHFLKVLSNLTEGRLEHLGDLKGVFNMTGASQKMIDIFFAIQQLVRGWQANEGLRKGVTVYLHSEPGCGKETIASLCHLLSPRCLIVDPPLSPRLRNVLKAVPSTLDNLAARNNYSKADQKWIDKFKAAIANIEESSEGEDPNFIAAYPAIAELLRDRPLLGYAPFNCGNLDKDNFETLLFGSEKRPGIIYRAHKLGGTAFLDEVNTFDRNVANRLLRVMEKPYQITVKDQKVATEKEVNVQVVFGSNRSPEELLADGFNSAVVFRIAERPFRIPPLRERKEDVAIFVNSMILNKKTEAREGSDEHVLRNMRRVSLDGLRLLCELHWPDNYRGLRGLVDDMLEERVRREIDDPEISFEEVIRAVSRREAMGHSSNQRRSSGALKITVD